MSDLKKVDSRPQEQVEHVEPIIGNQYDDLVSSLLASDKTVWYKKPNLRKLYLLFIGSVLCVETTSGYDASVLNGLQAVPRWVACKLAILPLVKMLIVDFNNPVGTMLGLIGAMYALGVSLSYQMDLCELRIRLLYRSHSSLSSPIDLVVDGVLNLAVVSF